MNISARRRTLYEGAEAQEIAAYYGMDYLRITTDTLFAGLLLKTLRRPGLLR